jgi:hypothetical protein
MGTHDNGNGNGVPFRLTLRELPLPVRLTLSLFLIAVGLGYFSALVQLHFQNASPGEALPTTDDVVEIFSGVENWSGKKPPRPKPVSKMEKLIMASENEPTDNGASMARPFFMGDSGYKKKIEKDPLIEPKLHEEREGERLVVQAWINTPDDKPDLRRQKAYENDALPLPAALANHPITKGYLDDGTVKVRSLIQDRCSKCHEDASQAGHKSLDGYTDFADVLAVPQVGHTSRQMPLVHLTQTTHLHLLSFSVLWTLTGLIFAFSSYPTWVRCILAPVVLLAQVADVSCWWLARLDGVGPYFALAIIGTGSVVGFGLFLQIVLSLFNMYRLPGRMVLLVLLGGAVAGCVAIQPIIDGQLAREKSPTTLAPTK